jgi:hypothetical protein
MTIYHLHLETRHYDFDVYGRTLTDARATLAAAWAKHCEQTDAYPDYPLDEATVRKIVLTNCKGIAFRDDSELVTR